MIDLLTGHKIQMTNSVVINIHRLLWSDGRLIADIQSFLRDSGFLGTRLKTCRIIFITSIDATDYTARHEYTL